MTYTPPKATAPLNFKNELQQRRDEIVNEESQAGPVKAWSPTLVDKFMQCRHRVFLGKVQKLKEPSGEAAERGTKIHDLAEHYVDGRIDELPVELKKFTSRFEKLKEGYQRGEVSLEGEWGYTLDWEPCGFFDKKVWLRIKLDACWFDGLPNSAEFATVIDYKTGKKFGNELKHGFQGLVYAMGTFMRYPNLNRIDTEFWYLDKGETLEKSYLRSELEVFLPRITKKGVMITSCTDFYPSPSPQNCRFCAYRETGQCDYACHDEAPSKKHESLKKRGHMN